MNPIEFEGNVDLIFITAEHQLEVELPRYSMTFTLRQGETALRSKNHAGMRVDSSQNIGTLIGLKSKLVLKPEGKSAGTLRRMVLVPRGAVSCSRSRDHVDVVVNTSDLDQVRYDVLLVDENPGFLRDSGSLSSKLWLCYLCVLTSGPLLDLLTRRTGTEEAYRILSSPTLRSFPHFDNESHRSLQHIPALSPRRTAHNHIETVMWSGRIPFLSQHESFWEMATAILDEAREHNRLFGAPDTHQILPFDTQLSASLMKRACVRNAIFRASQFGAETQKGTNKNYDVWYRGRFRESLGLSDDTDRVSLMVRCLYNGCQQLLSRPCSTLKACIHKVNGNVFDGASNISLSFAVWNLNGPSGTMGGKLCALHRALASESNKFKSIFFLANHLYSPNADWEFLQVLMGFATLEALRLTIRPPPAAAFNLAINKNALPSLLQSLIARHAYSFSECPEAAMPQLPDELFARYRQRRHTEWESATELAQQAFLSDLEAQFSRSWTVTAPVQSGQTKQYSSYLNVDEIMTAVGDYSRTARLSEDFDKYLDQVILEVGATDQMPDRDLLIREERVFGNTAPHSRQGFVSASALFSSCPPRFDRPKPDFF